MSSRAVLESCLRHLQDVNARLQADCDSAVLEQLRQARYRLMANDYEGLASSSRYRAAVDFLLNDLYGSNSFPAIILELQHAQSAMSRVLPDAMLATLARAVEFASLSLEIDMLLVRHLQKNGDKITPADYLDALSAVPVTQLRQQYEMVVHIGGEIEAVVHKPFVAVALKMCRKPARMMGLSVLQAFLEKGFHAFKSMHGSQEFFTVFRQCEQRRIDSAMAGNTDNQRCG